MGEPGRGIPTIIEMATYTRLNCVVGSAAMVRQGLVQGLAYARQRKAFGRLLIDQPLMRAVLTDLALENEANMVLMMRLAQAYERDDSPLEKAWKRVMTPAEALKAGAGVLVIGRPITSAPDPAAAAAAIAASL